MDLITDNLTSRRVKNDFGEVDEAMFQGVKSHEKPFSAFMALKKASLTNSLK
jgi:hypothetical protein